MKSASCMKKVIATASVCVLMIGATCMSASAIPFYPAKDMSQDWHEEVDAIFHCYYDAATGTNNQQCWASTEVETDDDVYAWAKATITSLANASVSRESTTYYSADKRVKVPAVYTNTPYAMRTQHDGLRAGTATSPRHMWTFTSS